MRLRCPDDKARWDIFVDALFDEFDSSRSCEWGDDNSYRVKPKEPVYEWQWIHKLSDKHGYKMTKEWMTETIANPTWIKFKPSKRLRK